jgi:hypothetical protein
VQGCSKVSKKIIGPRTDRTIFYVVEDLIIFSRRYWKRCDILSRSNLVLLDLYLLSSFACT